MKKTFVSLLAVTSLIGFSARANTGTGKTTTEKITTGTTTGTTTESERPIGMGSKQSMSDNTLAQSIKDQLSQDSSLSSKAKNVRVNAADGVVTVSGMVATQAERDKVEVVARRLAGDKRVNLDVSVE